MEIASAVKPEVTTTSEQRPPVTMATNFGSREWSLYTDMTVLL